MVKIYLIIAFLYTMTACNTPTQYNFEIQGHRGARGLAPENSMPAFKKALELGVHTLELDVVITKDKKVLISHEPYFSAEICQDLMGQKIDPNLEKEYNIYQLDYEEVQTYDCGSIGNARFPQQQKQPVQKPLLADMIKEIEEHIKVNKLNLPKYNIEIKSEPGGDGLFHPDPKEFSDLVYEVIRNTVPKERLIIQSFDKRVLQYWNQKYPDYILAYLVEEALNPNEMNSILGFAADIYSPYFKALSEELIKSYHEAKIKVIPWTINEVEDMKRVKSWGVDGIITDYPDRVSHL
ncbi:MAG: glycerophosphodiester phosphodiesterase [Bacteroidota bacterium]|nr:glycerophosphodiester phosphodiesterase [Bacteroidota bacterium]